MQSIEWTGCSMKYYVLHCIHWIPRPCSVPCVPSRTDPQASVTGVCEQQSSLPEPLPCIPEDKIRFRPLDSSCEYGLRLYDESQTRGWKQNQTQTSCLLHVSQDSSLWFHVSRSCFGCKHRYVYLVALADIWPYRGTRCWFKLSGQQYVFLRRHWRGVLRLTANLSRHLLAHLRRFVAAQRTKTEQLTWPYPYPLYYHMIRCDMRSAVGRTNDTRWEIEVSLVEVPPWNSIWFDWFRSLYIEAIVNHFNSDDVQTCSNVSVFVLGYGHQSSTMYYFKMGAPSSIKETTFRRNTSTSAGDTLYSGWFADVSTCNLSWLRGPRRESA